MTGLRSRALALAAVIGLGGLAACGSDTNQTENSRMAGESIKQIFSTFKRDKTVAVAPDAEAMARSSLELNKGPLILLSQETPKNVSILGMIGENGTMRTYATPTMQAVILRGGMLAGTRGLGFDMMSAEVEQTGRLIRARTPGTGKKVIRYLDGLGLERPIPLDCTVSVGADTSYPFAGQTWSGRQVVEHCEGLGMKMDDTFIVSAAGQIVASRQWISPQLGYVTIQTVRP